MNDNLETMNDKVFQYDRLEALFKKYSTKENLLHQPRLLVYIANSQLYDLWDPNFPVLKKQKISELLKKC